MSEWLAVSLLTGLPIADLTDLEVEKVGASMGRYETADGVLPVPEESAPPEWLRATKPWAAALILLDDNPNDAAHGIPVWGGIVNRRRRTEGDVVELDMITAEGYFDRVYVGDETFEGVAQVTIAETLLEKYAGPDLGGLPLRVQVVGELGQERDRQYFDQDDRTLYSVLRSLAEIRNGIEWYLGWEWQYDPDRLTPVVYIGSRVGTSVTTGLGPAATFELPGSVRNVTFEEDYGNGRGANDVMATSSGEGELRPQSSRHTAEDPERPRLEFRWQPSTSITNVDTLEDYAEERLPVMLAGAVAIDTALNLAAAPKLGVDWGIGDTVGYKIGGVGADGRQTVPGFPGGLEGRARVAGWERMLGEPQRIVPVLIPE